MIEQVGIAIEAAKQRVLLGPDKWVLAGFGQQKAVGQNLVAGCVALAKQCVPRARHRLPLHLVQRGQHILRDAAQHLALVHLEAQKAVAQHHLLQFETALVPLFQVLPAELQNTRELQRQLGAQKLDQRDPAQPGPVGYRRPPAPAARMQAAIRPGNT